MRLIKKNIAAMVCIVAVALPGYAARAQALDVARNDQAVLGIVTSANVACGAGLQTR